jgi:aquaporin Z
LQGVLELRDDEVTAIEAKIVSQRAAVHGSAQQGIEAPLEEKTGTSAECQPSLSLEPDLREIGFPQEELQETVQEGMKCYLAEVVGTFVLVFGGCGSEVLATVFLNVGIGLHGVSLAFGLTVLTMAYAIGHISGCHLNPAVSVGLWASKRFPASKVLPYIIAQVLGAIIAACVIYFIASGQADFDVVKSGLASNGYDVHSPGKYSLGAGLVAEIILTFMFLMIILGATDRRAPQGFAPIAIGLALTLIHLISIPVTNTSVNPARSTGPAIFVGGWALGQLWLFWVAPLLGAIVAGVVYHSLFGAATDK